MAARKNIKTNKYGEIEITATKDKVEFYDSQFSIRGAFVTRKAWEDANGNVWVKFNGAFYQLLWNLGSAYLPMDYARLVFGCEI